MHGLATSCSVRDIAYTTPLRYFSLNCRYFAHSLWISIECKDGERTRRRRVGDARASFTADRLRAGASSVSSTTRRIFSWLCTAACLWEESNTRNELSLSAETPNFNKHVSDSPVRVPVVLDGRREPVASGASSQLATGHVATLDRPAAAFTAESHSFSFTPSTCKRYPTAAGDETPHAHCPPGPSACNTVLATTVNKVIALQAISLKGRIYHCKSATVPRPKRRTAEYSGLGWRRLSL